MRRRLVSALAAATLAALLGVAPAAAIQYGQPDAGRHPYVAMLTFLDAGQNPLWRCTGTLISPTVVLTAAHCTGVDAASGVSPATAQVFFDGGPLPFGTWNPGMTCEGQTGYPCKGDVSGVPHANPGWNGLLSVPNTHDIGVVVLDAPYRGTKGAFGKLPTAGLLDSLASKRGQQDVSMTVVGYGVQSVKPVAVAVNERRVATTKLVQLKSYMTGGYNLRLSSNPGNWTGGTCFGDSGGPVFLNATNVVVAVNSFVLNANCRGSGVAYRVDTSASLAFVKTYLQ